MLTFVNLKWAWQLELLSPKIRARFHSKGIFKGEKFIKQKSLITRINFENHVENNERQGQHCSEVLRNIFDKKITLRFLIR